jgi:hypothetical protein
VYLVGVVCIAVAASADHVGVRAVDNDGNTIDHPDVDAAATNAGTAADDLRPHDTAAAGDFPDVPAADVPAAAVSAAAALGDTVQRAVGMSEQQEAPRVVPKWIGVVGLFIAPTTVITSLCYFYGYVATRKYFAYFGIDTDAIGFTTSDYVMRSVRALYVPVVAGLLTYLALLWAGPYLLRLVQSGRRTRRVRTLGRAAVAVGALSTAWAIVSLTLPQWALVHVDALTPVALGLGAAFLGVGVWMLTSSQTAVAPRPFAAAQRASLVVVAAAIVLALFWITDIFAIAYGEDQARITNARLWSQENSVVLDADARLYLPVPPGQIKVTWAPPADRAAKPTFLRYQCFRSLAVHGDRWVLVPARWTPEYGFAVIITADSSHVISVLTVKNIADTDAAKNRGGEWECPELLGDAKTK